MNINSSDTLPPPPPSPAQTPRKNRKILYAAVIIAIVAVASIAGAIAIMNNNPSQPNNANPTPTPTASPGSVSTPNPSTTDLSQAKSIEFRMSFTSSDGATQFAYKFSGKNLGATNMMARVEGTLSENSQNIIYIVNGAQQKAWMNTNGQWSDLSDDFQSQYNTWSSTWQGYTAQFNSLAGAGDFTYTVPVSGDTIKVTDLKVNPHLPDSLFVP